MPVNPSDPPNHRAWQRAPWTSASSAGRENPLAIWTFLVAVTPVGISGTEHMGEVLTSNVVVALGVMGDGTCEDVFGTRPGHLEELGA